QPRLYITSLFLIPVVSPHYYLFPLFFLLFFFNDPATTEIYTLSLHDALPISFAIGGLGGAVLRSSAISLRIAATRSCTSRGRRRSEEHTSELQSRENLVCRLLLEKKKIKKKTNHAMHNKSNEHLLNEQVNSVE